MNASKHTPGPWKVLDKLGKPHRYAVCTTSQAPIQGVICQMEEKSLLIDDETRLANARLIAAAPDLLEALTECVNGMAQATIIQDGEELTPHDDDLTRTCDQDDPQGCMICSARAAIAKAEGN